jgi:hypothetical protein
LVKIPEAQGTLGDTSSQTVKRLLKWSAKLVADVDDHGFLRPLDGRSDSLEKCISQALKRDGVLTVPLTGGF